MARNGRLNANQKRAIAALMQHSTARKAAEVAGIGESTMYHYLADPVFRAELARKQEALADAAMANLAGLASLALDALRESLEDEDTPPATRVRAAIAVLDRVERVLAHKAECPGDVAIHVKFDEPPVNVFDMSDAEINALVPGAVESISALSDDELRAIMSGNLSDDELRAIISHR